MRSRTWVRFAIATIAISSLAIVVARVNLTRVVVAIGMMSRGWAVVAGLMNLMTVVIEAARWRLVLSPVSRPSLLRTVQALLLGFTANLVLPLKLGDGARVVSLARWQRLPIATVAATVVLDRVLDATTFVGGVAVIAAAFELRTPHSSLARSSLVVSLLAVLAVATWWGRRRSAASWSDDEVNGGGFTTRTLAGLRVLRRGRLLPAIGALALLAWIGRGGVVWCMLQAFHLELPPIAAVSTLIALNVGISVVASPGNVGVYELSTAGALLTWGVPASVGISVGLAMHAIEIVPVVSLGLAVLASDLLSGRGVAG